MVVLAQARKHRNPSFASAPLIVYHVSRPVTRRHSLLLSSRTGASFGKASFLFVSKLSNRLSERHLRVDEIACSILSKEVRDGTAEESTETLLVRVPKSMFHTLYREQE